MMGRGAIEFSIESHFRVYIGVTYLFGSPWGPVDWFFGLGASVLCEIWFW